LLRSCLRAGLTDLYVFGDIKPGPVAYKPNSASGSVLPKYIILGKLKSLELDKHTTSAIAAQIAYTSPNDGRQRYGLRGPLSLPISSAPEQTIRCIQLPRVCKEKDNRCVQGSQCGDRCAQNARVDAEGSQGAAGVEGVYYWLSECWRVCDCMGVQTSVIYEIHGIVPGRMTD
jgi:hypothetical protein